MRVTLEQFPSPLREGAGGGEASLPSRHPNLPPPRTGGKGYVPPSVSP
jgi:hypothetical protein